MNTNNINLDPRVRRWGVVAKYVAILTVGFFIAPYIFTAITGLVGLGIAVAICGVTWMVLPALESFAQNMRLKLIKGEAARNPVEVLQVDLRNKTVALGERKEAIERLNGKIRTFADKVDAIRQKHGPQDTDYLKMTADLADLKRLSAHRIEKWKEAQQSLVRYSESIDRAGMIWDAAQAAASARESAGLSEEDFYAKLRSETAFDAIQSSYNEALASLDTLLTDESPKALPTPKTKKCN